MPEATLIALRSSYVESELNLFEPDNVPEHAS